MPGSPFFCGELQWRFYTVPQKKGDPGIHARIALLLRHRVEAPLQLAGFRIVRFEVTAHVGIVAADARDDVIPHHGRSHRGEIKLIEIADGLRPFELSVCFIDREQMAIAGLHINEVAEHGEAFVAVVAAAARRPDIVPQLATRARVDGPGVVFRAEVNRAVLHERRAADVAARPTAGVELPRPGKTERFHIFVVDLRRRTEPPTRKIAVVSRPRIGRHGRLRECARCEPKGSNEKYLSCHSGFYCMPQPVGWVFGPAVGLPPDAT